MTHLTLHYPSRILGTNTTVHILIPSITGLEQIPGQSPFPRLNGTLLLLHGMQNDPEEILLNTSIARYADACRLAVILPEGGNSLCVDPVSDAGYETFLTLELLPALRSLLPLSEERESTFIGGYSIGGYGSLRLALRHPELFSRCVVLSGALDVRFSAAFVKSATPALMPHVLMHPRTLPGSEYDLKTVFESFPHGCEKPELYFACGEDDYFCRTSLEYAQYAASRGFSAPCYITEGDHDWDYWNTALKCAMEWLISRA